MEQAKKREAMRAIETETNGLKDERTALRVYLKIISEMIIHI